MDGSSASIGKPPNVTHHAALGLTKVTQAGSGLAQKIEFLPGGAILGATNTPLVIYVWSSYKRIILLYLLLAYVQLLTVNYVMEIILWFIAKDFSQTAVRQHGSDH